MTLRASLRGTGSLVVLLAAGLSGCLLTTESVYRDSGPEVTTVDGAPDGAATDDGGAPDGASTDDAGSMADGVVPGDALADGATGDGPALDGGDASAGDAIAVDGITVDVITVDGGPPAEICNGVDDDGNGLTDENIPVLTCGTGACRRSAIACVNGVPQTCTPATPSNPPPEDQCDGQDNDCDGQTDEDARPIQCGLGACGTTIPGCVDGQIPACPAPGAPAPETCDGQDNDCNGLTDEGCPCDVYVSRSGRDAGAGTMSDPVNDINAGITKAVALGRVATVCVAVTPATGGTGCGTATYLQDVVMQPNVIVLGGYRSDTWTRDVNSCRTVIQATFSPSGVVFGHNTNDFTVLDGFDIRSIAADDLLSAVLMQSCGTLSDNTITSLSAAAFNSGTSVGVDVIAPLGPIPANCTAPIIRGNRIVAGPGGNSNALGFEGKSIGIRAARPTFIQANGRIEAGSANQSFGVLIDNAPGTFLVDNQLITAAPLASSNRSAVGVAAGVRVQGQADGVTVVRNGTVAFDPQVARRGIYGVGGYTISAGVLIDGTNTAQTPALVYLNGPIVGATAPALGIGVWSNNATTYVAYNESIVGRDAAGGSGIGVQCSGSTGACGVVGNAKLVGVQAATSSNGGGLFGIGILAGDSALLAAYQNRGVTGCTGSGMDGCAGISLDRARKNAADPTMLQSAVDSNQVDANLGGNQINAGISVHDAPALVSNNVVRTTGSGLLFLPDGGSSAVFHSNTVVAGGPVVSDNLGAMVAFHQDGAGTGASAFINNIAMCANVTTGVNSVAFAEVGQGTTPFLFQGNDLFGCGTAYFDSARGPVNDLAVINGLTDITLNGGNVGVDPLFANLPGSDFHLRPASPLIDRGSATVPLPFDFEAQSRPAGVGYDIGADEVSP